MNNTLDKITQGAAFKIYTRNTRKSFEINNFYDAFECEFY